MYHLPERGDKLEALDCVRYLSSGSFSQVFVVRLRSKSVIRLAINLFGANTPLVAKFDTNNEDSDLAREVRLLGRLKHPNVATCSPLLFTSDCNDLSYRFTLMRRFTGDLYDYLMREGKGLTEKETKHIAFQIGSGLEALHKVKIVHGDVKSENVLIRWTGRPGQSVVKEVKLADVASSYDFGVEPPNLPEDGHTMHKASPEALANLCIGPHVDIFSLGCLYAELRCYTPLFRYMGESYQMLQHLHAIRLFGDNEPFHPDVTKCLRYFTKGGDLKRSYSPKMEKAYWRYLQKLTVEEQELVHSMTAPNWERRPFLSSLLKGVWRVERKVERSEEVGEERAEEMKKAPATETKASAKTAGEVLDKKVLKKEASKEKRGTKTPQNINPSKSAETLVSQSPCISKGVRTDIETKV